MAVFSFSEFASSFDNNKRSSWNDTRRIIFKMNELCHGSYVPFVFVHAFANGFATWKAATEDMEPIDKVLEVSYESISTFIKWNNLSSESNNTELSKRFTTLAPNISSIFPANDDSIYYWSLNYEMDRMTLSTLKEYGDPFFEESFLHSQSKVDYFVLLDMLKQSLPLNPDYDETPKAEESYYDEKEEWLIFFDELIFQVNRYSGTNNVPSSLVRIVNGLFEDTETATLIDLYNNMGAFAMNVNAQMSTPREQKNPLGYLALEYDSKALCLTSVRLLLRDCLNIIGRPNQANPIKYDNIKPDKGTKTPLYYVAMPPFTNKDFIDGKYIDPIVDSITIGLSITGNGGKMACIVPSSVLVQKHYHKVREELLSSPYATKLVLLPNGTIRGTEVSLCIIFVDSTKKSDAIKFIDAYNYVKKDGKDKVIDYIAISNLCYHDAYPINQSFHFGPTVWTPNEYTYHEEWDDQIDVNLEKESFERDIQITLKEEIRQNDCDLNPSLYFNHTMLAPEGFEVKNLSKILSNVTELIPAQGTGKVISAKDLHKNNSLVEMDVEKLPVVDLNSTGRNFVYKIENRPTILISKVGSMSPTAIRPTETIYGNVGNINVYKIKDEAIDAAYLAGEMNKPYFTNQLHLSRMAKGINELILNKLNVFVPLSTKDNTSISIQQRIVEKDMLEKMGVIGEQLKRSNDERFNEYILELRQRKHRISQYLNNVIPALDNLKSTLDRNGGSIKASDIVSKRSGLNVKQYLEMIQDSVNEVDGLIDNLVDKSHWGTPEKIDLEIFAKDFTHEHIHTNYKFEVVVDNAVELNTESDDSGIQNDESPQLIVNMPKNELKEVFENIVANAEIWGFTDTSREDYAIRISLGITNDGNMIAISISNNGSPIDAKTDMDHIFEWGVGNHTGIGTYNARNIIRHYDGTISIFTYPNAEDGFKTDYEITIPREI